MVKTYKLLIPLLLFILSCQFAKAQHNPANKMFFLLEAGVFPRLGEMKFGEEIYDSKGAGTAFRFTAGYFVSPNLTVGLGIGTDNFRDPVINTYPIFADFRGVLSPNESSLFGYYKLGYGFKIGESDAGLINNIGLGYQIAVGSNFVIPSIGYHRLDFKQHWKSIETKGYINSLSIMVGYQF